MNEIRRVLKEICSNVKEKFPLSTITSFKTGGPASFFVSPDNIETVKKIITLSKEYKIPILFIGRATNVLISDKGFEGIVISTENLNKITVEKNYIYCQAGTTISGLLKVCIKESLKGIEFLSGIPGTVGGAVISNAGLKKEWISEYIVKVDGISLKDVEEKEIKREEIKFDYRSSGLEGYFIGGALLRLDKGEQKKIRENIRDYIKMRRKTQPLGYPSAGSIFKNPERYFAGEIIEKCGLKGYSIGGACVSEKHANFIINKGNATSEDIYKLICHIKECVKKMYNIELETEIKIIGSFGEK